MECFTCHSSLKPNSPYCPHCGARQADVPERDDFLYSAFISYRHRPHDEQVAKQVQQAIETYTLPKGVMALNGAAKLDRVFRDEDELPATDSLPGSITEALAKARKLVVVCSPFTKLSRWVTREIEEFAGLHGRNNIVIVLAEGASAEAIPPFLLTRLEVQSDGKPISIATEPLAADLRPESSGNLDKEKLRLIASIIDCDLNDLTQREQTRKRKQTRMVAAIVLVVALVLGGVGYHLLQSAAIANREKQATESTALVAQAKTLLANGDRYGAIVAALSALPSSESANDRPFVQDAQDVLEEALQVHPNSKSIWTRDFLIQLDNSIGTINTYPTTMTTLSLNDRGPSAIIPSNDGDWFLVADNTGALYSYSLATGKQLAAFEMDEPYELYENARISRSRSFACLGNYVVMTDSFSTMSELVVCFDALTGERKWTTMDAVFERAIRPTPDGNYVATACYSSALGLSATLIDVSTGKRTKRKTVNGLPLSDKGAIEITTGESNTDFFIASDSLLISLSLDNENVKTTPLAYPTPTSIEYIDGTLIVASVDYLSGTPEYDLPYAIQAFDANLNKLWSVEGSFKPRVTPYEELTSIIFGKPNICGFIEDTESKELSVFISSGSQVASYGLSTGEQTRKYSFSDTITGAWASQRGLFSFNTLVVATSDGSLWLKRPFTVDDTNAMSRFTHIKLPGNIRYAAFAYSQSTHRIRGVALPESDSTKIAGFDAYYQVTDNDRDYTLDELIKLAHETLRTDGYE